MVIMWGVKSTQSCERGDVSFVGYVEPHVRVVWERMQIVSIIEPCIRSLEIGAERACRSGSLGCGLLVSISLLFSLS